MTKYRYKYGIDFGTTNSSIALTVRDNDDYDTTVCTVEDNKPNMIMPSMVCVKGKTDLEVGRGVEVDDESCMARAIKLELEPTPPKFLPRDGTFNGERIETYELIAAVLERLREKADAQFSNYGVEISGVVIGVPVEFGDSQKKVLLKALKKAGFYKSYEQAERETEFVSEPLAVAVEYGERIKDDENVLVFDFGGGTLDIAIFNLKRDVAMLDRLHPINVISKHRETIGGEKLNKAFFVNSFCSDEKYGLEYLQKAFQVTGNVSAEDLWDRMISNQFGKNGHDFIERVEQLKCELSSKDKSSFKSFLGEEGLYIESKQFTSSDFKYAISVPLPSETDSAFDLIKRAIDFALRKKNLDPVSDIDKVITAGGSSLIPCVQEYLYSVFTNKLHKDSGKSDKMTSIVKGLSIVGCKDDIIDDVVDNDYGIWNSNNNSFFPIIESGTRVSDTIFNKATKEGKFVNIKKHSLNASIMEIGIFQRNANGIEKLGKIEVHNAMALSYKIYFNIDRRRGMLFIYLYDNDERLWLDDQGKLSPDETRYHLK